MEILQLSDIHYGADYDGKFNTANQWSAVVKDAKARNPKGYDAVVITGDLVDDDPNVDYRTKTTRYEDIFSDALSLCVNSNAPVLVTPGNHDNREILTRVAKELPVKSWDKKEQPKGFEEQGSQFLALEFNCKTVVLLDSGSVEPYKGIAKLAAHSIHHPWRPEDTMIFTHKPFRNERLYHRFMVGTDNVMSRDFGHLIHPYAKQYFCGHFHHWSQVDCGVMDMFTCPCIQCQIDPYSKGCVPIATPGYQVIEFNTYANAEVVVHPVILSDYEP